MRFADGLIDRIVGHAARVPWWRRQEIRRELRCHFEDFAERAAAAGHSEAEMEQLIARHFGDTDLVAGQFAVVYRHERRLFLSLVFTATTIGLSALLMALVLCAQSALALGWRSSVINVIASRHTLIEALNVFSSVVIYSSFLFMEAVISPRQITRAAVGLIVGITMCAAAWIYAGLPYYFLAYGLANGVFCHLLQRLVKPWLTRVIIAAFCFMLAGLGFVTLRFNPTPAALAETGASWLVMGCAFQLMTYMALRIRLALTGYREQPASFE